MNILLVDDSKLQRWTLQKILEKAGYAVLPAADGEQALELARSKPPDLILLDMILPRMDGPSVLAALKGDPKTAAIPVIALTSLSQKNESKLKSAGAAAYCQKSELGVENGAPLLLTLIREVVSETRQNRSASAASA